MASDVTPRLSRPEVRTATSDAIALRVNDVRPFRSGVHPLGGCAGLSREVPELVGAVLGGVRRVEDRFDVVVEVRAQPVVGGAHGHHRPGPAATTGRGHRGLEVNGLAHEHRRDLVVVPHAVLEGARQETHPRAQGIHQRIAMLTLTQRINR